MIAKGKIVLYLSGIIVFVREKFYPGSGDSEFPTSFHEVLFPPTSNLPANSVNTKFSG